MRELLLSMDITEQYTYKNKYRDKNKHWHLEKRLGSNSLINLMIQNYFKNGNKN